ncbi:MAG TPA: STAS domain-containing protein [Solirubrobacteraceae bacterium]|nr:STAS domain-containing protein [Solirubrobacteraceae bacterium]
MTDLLGFEEADHAETSRLRVWGELDMASVPPLQDRLLALVGAGRTVELDLSGLTFMDSSGLNLLIAVARAAAENGGALAVAAVSPEVRRVLDLSGVAERLGLLPRS